MRAAQQALALGYQHGVPGGGVLRFEGDERPVDDARRGAGDREGDQLREAERLGVGPASPRPESLS